MLERGHPVHLVFEREEGAPRPFERAWLRRMEAHPRFHSSPSLAWRRDPWFRVARPVRGALDYVYFLQLGATVSRTSAARPARAPRTFRLITAPRDASGRACAGGDGLRLACDRAIPVSKRVQQLVRENDPDVVLVTPHLMPSSTDAHYARSAQATGVPTAICIAELGQPLEQAAAPGRPRPASRSGTSSQKRGGGRVHGVPADRVVATGAQCFDHWFGWPPRPREEFCARVGLDPAKPLHPLRRRLALPRRAMTEAESACMDRRGAREPVPGCGGRRS